MRGGDSTGAPPDRAGAGPRAFPGVLATVLSVVFLALAVTFLAAADGPSRSDTTPPAPVAGLTASDARDGKVNLGWTPGNETDFAFYAVYYGTAPFLTVNNRTAAVRIDNMTVRNFTVANLTDGTEYFFAVTAVDQSGNENRTVISASATPTAASVPDTTPPPAVTGLSASDARSGKVNLTWTPVNVSDFRNYWIYFTTRANEPVQNLEPTLRIDRMSERNLTVSGLKDNTTYFFAVTAVDLSGNEDRSVVAAVSATPTPAPQPKPPAREPPGAAGEGDISIGNVLLLFTAVAIVTFLVLERVDEPWRRPAAAGAARPEGGNRAAAAKETPRREVDDEE